MKNGGKISLNLLAEPGHIGYTAFKSIHSFAFLAGGSYSMETSPSYVNGNLCF